MISPTGLIREQMVTLKHRALDVQSTGAVVR